MDVWFQFFSSLGKLVCLHEPSGGHHIDFGAFDSQSCEMLKMNAGQSVDFIGRNVQLARKQALNEPHVCEGITRRFNWSEALHAGVGFIQLAVVGERLSS